MEGLKELLSKRNDQDFLGHYILVSDSQSNSDFIINYFITQALKDGHSLCLVSIAQSLTHYQTIATKLGVDLKALEQSKQFIFIDCLTHRPEPVVQQSGCHGNIKHYIESSLNQLFQLVKQVLTSFSTSKPVCLIIDDLSILLSLGISLKEIVIFINYCCHLITSDLLDYLITRIHNDKDVEDESEHLLEIQLVHLCHLHLHTEGLLTGYSRDVHGELTVERRDPAGINSTLSQAQTHTMQYRVLDRGVHLFSRGTSRAVL